MSLILDIIIILLVIAAGYFGYKIGFLTSLVKVTSTLSGIIIALIFSKPLTNLFIKWGWGNWISERAFNNIIASDAFYAYTEGGEGVKGVSYLLQQLGLPSFISNFIAPGIVDSIDPIEAANGIAGGISYVFVFIFTFLGLLIFSSIGFFILKLCVKGLRKASKFIRILDGILGIIFFLLMLLIVIYITFMIFSLIIQSSSPDSGFATFILRQLHLNDDRFGIAKYFYKNNIIGNFFGLLF